MATRYLGKAQQKQHGILGCCWGVSIKSLGLPLSIGIHVIFIFVSTHRFI